MRLKIIVCLALFAALTAGGWLLQQQLKQQQLKPQHLQESEDVPIMRTYRSGQAFEPIRPFRPREYIRIVRYGVGTISD